MKIEIYSAAEAARLAPNMVIDTDRYGPLVIDEVRKTWNGTGEVVDAYGRRPDAPEDSKQRRRVRFAAADVVRLQPDVATASAAWTRVVDAVRDAVESWADDHGDEELPLWDVLDDGTIRVRVDGAYITFTDGTPTLMMADLDGEPGESDEPDVVVVD